MRHQPTARGAVLTGFGSLARSVGLLPTALLRSVGLPPDAELEPDRRLPVGAVNRLFELAAEQSGLDDFGLRLAELRGFSNLGPITLLARDEPDIRSALGVFTSYLPLHNEALSINLSEADGFALLSCVVAGEGRRIQATDVAVAMLYRILRQLLGSGWDALGVYLERPRPAKAARFDRLFSGQIHFAAGFSGIAFNAGDLDRPNVLAEAGLRPYTAQLRASLSAPAEVPLAEHIRRLLQAMMASRRCTAPLVAERIGMSRRTMERRLAVEGVSFHELLDEVRNDVACGQLSGSSRSNAEIAVLLGFASSAAFTAWFSKRHGLPPQAWRTHMSSRKDGPSNEVISTDDPAPDGSIQITAPDQTGAGTFGAKI